MKSQTNKALENVLGKDYELDPEVRKKLSLAYKALIKGGVYQGVASKGGLAFAEKLSSANAVTEIQNAVNNSKLGITEKDLRSFPDTVKDFAGNFKKGYSAVEKLREVKGMEDETNKEATDLIKKESREEANKIMASITGEEKTFGIGLPFGISLPSGKTPENGYEEDESDNQ